MRKLSGFPTPSLSQLNMHRSVQASRYMLRTTECGNNVEDAAIVVLAGTTLADEPPEQRGI